MADGLLSPLCECWENRNLNFFTLPRNWEKGADAFQGPGKVS